MKTSPLLLALTAVLLVGCDHQQNQLLSLREDLQKQMQAKDKAMEELHARVTELQAQNSQLQDKLLAATKESGAPEKLADALGDKVTKKAEEQIASALADINGKLASLEQAVKASQATVAQAPAPQQVAPSQRSAPAPTQQAQPQSSQGQIRTRDAAPSDPNRKKYKFEF